LQLVPKFKLQYFDRSVIKSNWKQINSSPLSRSGSLVKKISRQSIRRGGKKKKPSKAGTPPRSHKPGSVPPFKQIYSLPVDPVSSVTVGMVGYGGKDPVPGLHEHGETATRIVIKKRKRKRPKGTRVSPQRLKRIREKYALMVAAQAAEGQKKTVRYPQRPFMAPALDKAKSRLPDLWENSLR
jgi:hypothetical protein